MTHYSYVAGDSKAEIQIHYIVIASYIASYRLSNYYFQTFSYQFS